MTPHALVLACLLLAARAAPRAAPPALDDIELDVLEPSNDVLPPAPLQSTADELQLKRLDENSNDYIPDPDAEGGQRKVPLDLKNPGPPQRQEHETQNPGHFGAQERAIIAIQEKLDLARSIFDEQIRTMSSSFDALVHGSDNLPLIHEQVRTLRTSFSAQLDELNNTIRSHVRPCEDLKTSLRPDEEPKDIEANLKEVQQNFDNGLSVISEGLELISILKEEDEAALRIQGKDDAGTTSTTTLAPATVAQTQGFFQNAFTTFSNLMSNSFQNFQNGLSNLAGQGAQQAQQTQPAAPPAGAQADAPAASAAPATPAPQRPIAQGIQSISNFFTNILNRPQTPAILQPQAGQASNAVGAQASSASANPPQQQASPQPTAQPQPAAATQPGPIAQFIQSNPIVQRVTSILRPTAQPLPQPAQAPAQAAQPQPQPQPQSQPAQPAAQAQAAQPEAAQPQAAQSQAAQPQAAQPQAAQPQAAQPQAQPAQAQPGPIQQIVQNNPIIRGLQAAVQRVQDPRPQAQNPSTPRENEEKGHGGHGGNYTNQGDNNVDSGVAAPASEVKNLGHDAVTQEVKEQEIKESPSDEKTEA